MILEKINQANDIKKINPDSYKLLAKEIREFIINNVSSTGGHLSSNLGVVELTLALHLSFELPKDKLIWDVGHQAYTHKILTGRKNDFSSLRKYEGMSGFTSMEENPSDAFGTGHASTSLSAGLGYVKARDLSKSDHYVVSVIGDGALTGGMAFEALNNAGILNSNYIIILNDNEMSISENVGGISNILNNIRTDEKYNELKDNVKQNLAKIPKCGDNLITRVHKTKSSFKQFFIPNMIFEDMGITYLGPVDGHNISQMVDTIDRAKRLNHAVLIHVKTKKGKGYSYSESNPSSYHGVEPFNAENGKPDEIKNKATYQDVFSEHMMKMAKKDNKIVAISAAMCDGTGLKKFRHYFPERFVDVGIAEEHAVTFSAGLACGGYKPYFAVYSTFLQRSFDQIMHDVCLQNLPVRFIIEKSGVAGKDGATHQGLFDLSYLNLMPGMTIMAPKNKYELNRMLDFSMDFEKPLAIRFPKAKASEVYSEYLEPIVYGKSELIETGEKVAILAIGTGVGIAKNVRLLLKESGINPTIINGRFIKPLDTSCLDELCSKYSLIVTIEENIFIGGFGASVLEYVYKKNPQVKVLNIAFPDEYIPHGDVNEICEVYGYDSKSITDKIIRRLNE